MTNEELRSLAKALVEAIADDKELLKHFVEEFKRARGLRNPAFDYFVLLYVQSLIFLLCLNGWSKD